MSRTTSIAVTILLALPSVAAAQEGPSATIDAFNGFPWGTKDTVIFERLGTPIQVDTLEQDILVLVYRDTLSDIPTVAMYAIFPDVGLVKGQHTAAFDEGSDCERMFRTLRNHVLLAYPMITPVDQSRNDSMKGFCEAAAEGSAEWISTWQDSTTGARAMVVIDAGRPRVSVIFESAMFIEWVEQRGSVND